MMEVKVGDKFAVRKQYGMGYSGNILTVAKVYKNKRFVMEGDSAPLMQWSVFGDCIMAGGGSRTVADPLTDEVRAKMLRDRAIASARNKMHEESDRLAKLARSDCYDEMISEAARISKVQP